MSKTKRSVFGSKRFNIIFSVVFAVALWVFTVIVISPYSTKTVSGVPLRLNLENTATDKLGLALTGGVDQTFSMTVRGKRYNLSQLNEDDFYVTVSVSSVATPGKYVLSVTPQYVGSDPNVSVADFSPKEITLSFDKVNTRTYPLSVDIPSATAANGYFLDIPTALISEVNITAPDTTLDSISTVVARIKGNSSAVKGLNSTAQLPADIVALDAEGNEVTGEGIVFDYNETEVTLPVLVRKVLPVTAQFVNAPEYFEDKPLAVEITPDRIEIAGDEEVLSGIDSINASAIDFSRLSRSSTAFTQELQLPTGVKSIDNTSSVSVNVDLSGYSDITVSVANFRIKNSQPGAVVSVETTRLQNVAVVVPTDKVTAVGSMDIFGEIDLENKSYKNGEYTLPVTFKSNSVQDIWGCGEYTVIVKVGS